MGFKLQVSGIMPGFMLILLFNFLLKIVLLSTALHSFDVCPLRAGSFCGRSSFKTYYSTSILHGLRVTLQDCWQGSRG